MAILEDGFEILEAQALGAKLGEGSYKSVFVYEPNPAYVVAVLTLQENESVFEEERLALTQMKRLQIPAVAIEATGVVLRPRVQRPGLGWVASAFLMKRYAASDRCESAFRLGSFLNERSIASCVKILQRLDELRLGVRDLQFLVDAEGEVVINDPGALVSDADDSFEYRDTRAKLWDMIGAARYAISAREIGHVVVDQNPWELRQKGRIFVRSSGYRQAQLLQRFPVLGEHENWC